MESKNPFTYIYSLLLDIGEDVQTIIDDAKDWCHVFFYTIYLKLYYFNSYILKLNFKMLLKNEKLSSF